MHKMRRQLLRVIRGILFIGMSVQIVLGIFWMLGNFSGFQQFAYSYDLVNVSKSFLCDEYTGILYPVLIMLSRGAQKLFPVRYYHVLYLTQLLAACYAAHRFLKACLVTCGRCGRRGREAEQDWEKNKSNQTRENNKSERERKQTVVVQAWEHNGARPDHESGRQGKRRGPGLLFWDIWGTLCLLTVPMAMQCHLAVLPNSLTLSFFLVMISYVLEASGRPGLQIFALVRMLPLWLVTALLMPEYKVLSAIPIFLLFLVNVRKLWRQNRRQLLRVTVLLAIFAVMLAAVGRLTQAPGSHGRMRLTVSATAVRRFVWPWFTENYNFWPGEILEIMGESESQEISWYADYVTERFGPMVEQAVGHKEAQRLYRKMAAEALNIHTGDIAREIVEDAVSYTMAPMMLGRTLKGKGNASYSGRNYEIMKNNTPGLTKNYVWYGNWWFCSGLVLGVLCYGIGYRGKGRSCADSGSEYGSRIPAGAGAVRGRRAAGRVLLLLLLTSGGMVLLYTMSGAGMMDYKNTVFITLLWYSWMLKAMNGDQRDEKEAFGE